MTGYHLLTDQAIAEYFLQAGHTVRPGDDALDLEPRIEAWLSRANMGHRSALAVAIEAVKMAEPEPATIRQRSQNQMPDVSSMSMQEYAAVRREQLGMGPKDLIDFLGGS
jgi:hypothetical protein